MISPSRRSENYSPGT